MKPTYKLGLAAMLVFFIAISTIYAMSDTELEKIDNKRQEVIEGADFRIQDSQESITNNEQFIERQESLILQAQNMIEERKRQIKTNKACKTINQGLMGTEKSVVNCFDLPNLLEPDDLFYTLKVSDNGYITQGEENHFHSNRGGVLATDVATGFKAEVYAPDYLSEVKVYTVEVLYDKLLGNYAKLSFVKEDREYYWIIAHLETKLETGDIVYTGQRIGQMDMSGVTTGYHSHIELWKDGVNISYSQRSAIISEIREYQDYDNKTHEHEEHEEEFSYTIIEGEGNLQPDSQKYKDAGEKYGIDWRMISAIHCAETFDTTSQSCSRHTKNPKSYAGAQGCMQFMPKTWDGWLASSTGYGVDGDGDGVADINNCMDSIHSAANMLSDNYSWHITDGKSEEKARWFAYRQYNHADWYANRAQNIYNTLLD